MRPAMIYELKEVMMLIKKNTRKIDKKRQEVELEV